MPNIKHLKVERVKSEKYENKKDILIDKQKKYYLQNRESILRKNKSKIFNCICGDCNVSFVNRMRHFNSNKHKQKLSSVFQNRIQLNTFNKIKFMIDKIHNAIQKIKNKIENPESEIPIIEIPKKQLAVLTLINKKTLTINKLPSKVYCICGLQILFYWRKRHIKSVNHSTKLLALFQKTK